MAPVKTTTSKRLGELLLKGWAMLAENCPGCQVPLMKERASEERLCVNCDTTFVPAGQGLRPTNRDAEPAASPLEQPQTLSHELEEEAEVEGDGPEAPYDPLADARLGPFSSATDAGAAANGASNPAAAAAQAATGATSAADAGEGAGPGGMKAAAAGPASTGSGRDAVQAAGSAIPSSSPSSDDVADLLSVKMLQGWALLDKCCPRCNTVLVRSKTTRRMFCVSCDAWVLTEAEHMQQQQDQQALQQKAGPASEPAASPLLPPPAVATQALPAAERSAPAAPSGPPIALAGAEDGGLFDRRSHGSASSGPSAAVVTGNASTASSHQQHLAHPLGPLHTHAPGPIAASTLPSALSPASWSEQQPLTQLQGFIAAMGGEEGSRGSSPPPVNHRFASSVPDSALAGAKPHASSHGGQQQQQRQHLLGAGGLSVASISVHGGSKPPGGTALLLSIGRTVTLKMAEAQGLLERTSVLDTERARSYVSFIGECLDLLTKLHGLQQQ